jgi:porin
MRHRLHFIGILIMVVQMTLVVIAQSEATTVELPSHHSEVLREAWHPGKPELDIGQGIIGQLAPNQLNRLAKDGIYIFGWYMVALQGNAHGGIKKDFDYAGLFDLGLELDLEKLVNAKGLFFHISGSWTSGDDLTDDVGSSTPVNAVFSGDTVRLFEMYLEQKFFEDRLSLRAGRLAVGWEYGLDYDLFTQYLSAGFRLNSFGLDPNTPNFSVIPFANWGARLRWTPNENWRLQASFMNGYPRDFADDSFHGVNFDFRPDLASFLIGEATYQWLSTKKKRKANPNGLPGRVVVGGFFDTGDFPFVNSAPLQEGGMGTAYMILRQKIWEPETASDRGIDLWTSFTYAWDEVIVSVPSFLSGGMVYKGPFASRPNDSLALGVANSWFSDFLVGQSFETTLEVAYTLEAQSWLDVTGSLQYVINPGGTGAIPNAFVPGLLLYITF